VGCRNTLPPGEPKQCKPWLWIPSEVAGLAIAPLRLVKLATQPMQLALLVNGSTESQLDHR
jgi:hypothetical protein